MSIMVFLILPNCVPVRQIEFQPIRFENAFAMWNPSGKIRAILVQLFYSCHV